MKKKKSNFERRFSAGGVVFRKKGKKAQILLLCRIKKDRTSEWMLPKGEIEEDNTQKTALREISEETGLKKLKLIDRLGQEKYFYRESWAGGKLIFKIVTYFLVESKDKRKPTPQKEEGFIEARWFTIKEALDKITYKESKKILKQAVSKINPKSLPDGRQAKS